MCGIVGFTGSAQAAPILLDGLSKLEYRGYDSAGLAVQNAAGKIEVVKAKGRLRVLSEMTDEGKAVQGCCGIGHTRWATHGEPSVVNAHPHYSRDQKIAVVHNGIIENYQELKTRLIGYVFGLSIPFNDQRVIENGDDYGIQRTGQEDKEYLEIYGRLNTGISFIMQTPLSSIQESAKIANRFYALAGCLGAMAGGIIIWFVSRSVTKPILELNNISERMVQLDFEAKYQGKAHNEIDLLGENINKLSDSLEKTISELKTANNELQRDVEKKEAIDEMRKEFLANVSHELKTPIALIQGYAEGLQEEINDDPESRQFYCDVIVDEAAKMNNMVKKLLTLNQLEFGNDVVAMERFDLTALVKNYIQSAAILTKQHEITVRMEEYPPIYAWADEFKIEEVFMNFFSNAVNHCEDDKIIEVKMEQKDGKVRVSVFNTGKPIPEDSIHHIWEKFYKVDKARTREYGGSGVGLSIVKAIMESMNQQFGVNNYNNGVEFWFELETK